MPILTGFPASNTISPSVRIIEQDFSFYNVVPSEHTAGIVGFATKGPLNVATSIQSVTQLHTTFGFPHPDIADPYMIYAAEQYLAFSNQVYIVRCGETEHNSPDFAITAQVNVPSAGNVVNIIGNVTGPFVFSHDVFFRFRVNGNLKSHVLTILAGTYTVAGLVTDLNAQLTADDGVTFYSTTNVTLGIKSTFAYGTGASVELVSIQNQAYGTGSLLGLGTSMAEATITATIGKYPNNQYQTAGSFNLTTFTDLYLLVVLDGTDNVNIDQVVQTVNLPSSNTTTNALAQYINAQVTAGTVPGGFVAFSNGNNLELVTNHSGRDAAIFVKASSSAASLFGFPNATQFGTSSTVVSGGSPDTTYSAGIVTGSAATAGDYTFTVYADSPGTEGNLTVVQIDNDTHAGTFQMHIYNDGVQRESWAQIVKDSTSQYYVETLMALVSDYIRVTDNTAIPALPLPGSYTLTGGTNGIPTDPDEQDNVLIGNSEIGTGMEALSEPEQVDIDLLAIPGHSSTNVILAGLNLCQNERQDCFFVVDPPFGLSTNEIVLWQNGRHPLNLTKFDNDFGALYYPWVQIRDAHNRINVWVPPSGCVLATYVNSDNLSFPWEAPAGETRGVVFNILDTYTKPTLPKRDLMYGFANCINPIIKFADLANFTIWGQKTLQRVPSALDRVNVRRGLLYMEKLIRRQARHLLFEPNDAGLRRQFTSIISATMDAVKRDRGVYDYKIVCDDSNNPPSVVNRNELRANLLLQPTKSAEFIYITFSIFQTGSFTEPSTTIV